MWRVVASGFVISALLITSAGCDWVTKSAPEKARVRLEGASGVTVQLITSTVFVAREQPTGGIEVSFLDADTTSVSLPFEKTYDIRIERRFVARVMRSDPESDGLVMHGWIDGRERFNRPGRPVPEDSLLQFVYVYQSNNPSDGGEL